MNAQDEIIIILKCSLDEGEEMRDELNKLPRQIFYHIMDVYDKTSKGYRLTSMSHLLYDFDSAQFAKDIFNINVNVKEDSIQSSDEGANQSDLLLDHKDNVGFFYYQPTIYHYHALAKYRHFLPADPFLLGYLVQKWEIPWAKLFPLRLFLRFGEQFDCKCKLDKLKLGKIRNFKVIFF